MAIHEQAGKPCGHQKAEHKWHQKAEHKRTPVKIIVRKVDE
jgi:hypothetical protein